MGQVQPVIVDTKTARLMLGGIGKTKLFELFKDAKLKRVKIGTKAFVPVASIQEYAASLEVA